MIKYCILFAYAVSNVFKASVMNYEDIAKGERFENVEKHLYRAVQGISEISPAGKEEFEKAKSNLSIVSPKSNISLYDHLSAILRRILRFGIEDPVDKLEDISLSIKSEKETREESEIIEITPSDEVLKKFIEEKKLFYKLTSEVSREEIRTAEEDDESEDEDAAAASTVPGKGDEDVDVDEDESTPGLTSTLPDLHFRMHRFSLAGIGLSADEIHELDLSLKQLADTHKLEQVRFWGKLFAISCCYYVAESSYQSGIPPEDYGWKPDVTDEVESDVEKTSMEDLEAMDASLESEDEPNEEEAEDDEVEESEVPEERVIPPVPEPKVPKQKIVPPEEDGTGVNDKLYFVSTRIGQPWKRLPSLKPYHISDARSTQRYFTGHLESEVGGCMPFNGKEAHYLRAQIARISASTYLSPDGYYQTSDEALDEDEDENEDEDEDEEEETNQNKLFKSESYEFKPALEMYSYSFKAWVHCRPAILDQGRCIPIKPDDLEEIDEDEDEEAEEKDEEEDEGEEKSETKDSDEKEIFEALKEAEVPLLRSIAEDKALGRLQPWTLKLSSKLARVTSILILQSNLWPGAYTFYDGKVFDSIYIGFGHKYSTYHYAPAISFTWQKEYEVDSDLVEPEDSEVETPEEEENEDVADDEEGDKRDDDEDDNKSDEEEGNKSDEEEVNDDSD